MRGCFSILLLGVAFIAGVTWFAGPPAAGFAVEQALAGNGFAGTATTVTVAADPPLELLLGHADSVLVRSERASVGGLEVDRLSIRLDDVDLLNRRFAAVDGQFDGVALRAGDGSTVQADSIRLLGLSEKATATVRIAGAVVARLAREAILRQLGLVAGDIALVAPDLIRFNIAGIPAEGRFEVAADGALYVAANFAGSPKLKIVAAGDPLDLSSVVVDGGDVVVVGTLDVERLLLR